jgi:hypothetical protein
LSKYSRGDICRGHDVGWAGEFSRRVADSGYAWNKQHGRWREAGDHGRIVACAAREDAVRECSFPTLLVSDDPRPSRQHDGSLLRDNLSGNEDIARLLNLLRPLKYRSRREALEIRIHISDVYPQRDVSRNRCDTVRLKFQSADGCHRGSMAPSDYFDGQHELAGRDERVGPHPHRRRARVVRTASKHETQADTTGDSVDESDSSSPCLELSSLLDVYLQKQGNIVP